MKMFAAFIMTYERPQEVLLMIGKLFAQSHPPEKILVVDNSAGSQTKEAIERLSDRRVEYLRTGYNAGPAGASAIALRKLAGEGYQWIFWGDDNDPPKLNDDFRRLLALADHYKPGIIGAVGHHFNRSTGTIVRLSSDKLKGLLDVDTVAGGDCMIINADVVKRGVVPDEKLFFGFEEFDFCYRVKQAGFRILVDGDLFYKYREVTGNLGKKRKLFNMKSSTTYLRREYYSKRNLVYVYKKNRLILPLLNLSAKSILKCVGGFRYGFSFGMKNIGLLSRAIFDGVFNRMGKTLDLR